MIHDVRIRLIDAAIAAIAVADVGPDSRASVGDRAVILQPGQQPLPGRWIAREIFDFGNPQAIVQRIPCGARVRRTKDAAIAASVDDFTVVWPESQTVLIGMDALSALCRHVRPFPRRAIELSAECVNGANENLFRVVRRRGHIPVVLRLTDL